MLSRVADAIYWMSRYVERAENLARFIDVTLNMMLDLPEGMREQWMPLIYTTGDHETFEERHGTPNQENVIRFLAFDRQNPNSILSCLHGARENARSVRDTISSEMWEELNTFYYMVKDAAENRGETTESAPDFFHDVKMGSHLFKGITDNTMSRNEGWHFARMGRLLERADKTTRLLDVKYFLLLPSARYVGTSLDDLQWSALLRSVSGFEMYRKRFHGITPSRVIDFLVLDRQFPMSVHFCVENAEHSLHEITGTPMGTFRNAPEMQLGRLRYELAFGQVEDIVSAGLHQYLDDIQTKLNKIGDTIHDSFLAIRQESANRVIATA